MKIAVASDERTHLTDVVVEELGRRGHKVRLFGSLADEAIAWPLVSQQLAECVVAGEAEEGVLFCFTGTGATIAANKVPGVRRRCAMTPRQPAARAGGTTPMCWS